MIEITFGYSSSANYQVALALEAGRIGTSGEGREARHAATYSFEDLPKALKLWDLVGNWKSAHLEVGGEELDRAGIGKLKAVYECWRKGHELPNTAAYCRELTPRQRNPEDEIQRALTMCRQMRILKWGFTWLEHGYVTMSGTWAIDRNWIRGQAENELWRTRADLCPLFNRAALNQVLEAIPAEFNPSWVYETARDKKLEPRPSNVIQFRGR